MSCIIGFIFIANPLLLENLMYRNASLELTALGMLPVVLAIYTLNTNKILLSILLGSLILIISICIYQSSIDFFIGLSILYFLKNIYDKQNPNKALIVAAMSATQALLAVFIYTNVLLSSFVKNYVYSFYNSQPVSFSLASLKIVLHNIHSIYTMLVLNFFNSAGAKYIFYQCLFCQFFL